MNDFFKNILLFSLIPVLSVTLGGLITTFYKVSPAFKTAILHFAAGVVFSVVAVELLPDVVKIHEPVQVVLGFVLGVVTMLAVRYFAEGLEKKESGKPDNTFPVALFLGIGIDIFIDGLLVGIGFSAGNKEGILLTLAIGIEVFALGMATATTMQGKNLSKKTTLTSILGLGGVFFTSAVLGATLLHTLSKSVMEVVLSFGLSALLFLVTEELLLEAHEEEEKPWQTATFFAGFLLFLILGMV